MKRYIIILDGAADRGIKEFGGKTPLELARKPILDSLAKTGSQSMISIIDQGIVPESDSGTLALLSYDPLQYYPGRGTLEGLGSGMVLGYRFHASFRINFACYDLDHDCLDGRTARDLSDQELQGLAKELQTGICLEPQEKVGFQIMAFGRHRGILSLISNEVELSGNVSNTDPGFRKIGQFSMPVSGCLRKPLLSQALDLSDASERTAYYVNLFVSQARAVLENSQINQKRIRQGKMPANCILVRDGCILPRQWPRFSDKFHWSLMMYGQLPSEKAIADLIGAEFTYTKALELQLDQEYLRKMALDLAQDSHDVVYIHLKGPDEPGHDQNPREKMLAIERIDQYFMSELAKYFTQEDLVIVTCDHATPCELGIHSADRVPLLLSGHGVEADGQKKFSEANAKVGGCEIKKATEIFTYIRQLEGR